MIIYVHNLILLVQVAFLMYAIVCWHKEKHFNMGCAALIGAAFGVLYQNL